ncbi:MAG: GTPase, partial [Bacillota bacterium]|nr:GTPase [Bacillota bacterium]
SIYVLQGAQVQLVEVPGMIEGAREGKGQGKALLSCIRNADAVLLAVALGSGAARALSTLWNECREALGGKEMGICLTKCD